MTFKNKYFDPVNYIVTGNEGDNFADFLNELTDVPESQPLHSIDITRAGIVNQNIFLKIHGFDNEITSIYCDVELSVGLQGHRGIHMSRCEEILFQASEMTFKNLTDASLFIAKGLQEKQDSQTAFVKISGIYFMNHFTHKTHKKSLDKVIMLSEVHLNGIDIHNYVGLKVFNITACPCTRTYTKFSVVPALSDLGLSTDMINKVLQTTLTGTHMQRGTTLLQIEDNLLNITHKDLFHVLNESVHLIFDLLKRPDEHDLVVRALKKPQFTEDVSRDVVVSLNKNLGTKISDSALVFIESILNDSIHIHDVKTIISEKFIDLKKQYE